MKWFPGGPSLSSIPLPLPDPAHPWGSSNCSTYSGLCTGHYLKPKGLSQSNAMVYKATVYYSEGQSLAGTDPSKDLLEGVAKKTLLPVNEVSLWLYHLKNNTRKQKTWCS